MKNSPFLRLIALPQNDRFCEGGVDLPDKIFPKIPKQNA
jgi:hypothetical protein